MDMLETGNGAQAAHANGRLGNMTLDESITEFSMWAISASPLVVTTPIMNCTQSIPPASGSDCNVTLVQRHSTAKCVAGESFGCTGGKNASEAYMWTTNGCRGDFKCDGKPVTCNVDGDGTHNCPCSGDLPKVKCVPMLNEVQRTILLNEEVIAINQDVTPQGRPVVDGDLTVWARNLTDGSVALALYNENDEPASIGVDFPRLGWTASTRATVRDLWAHSDNGTVVGSIRNMTVRPHAVILVRLTQA